MRLWICSAEIRTRRLVSLMSIGVSIVPARTAGVLERRLAAEFEACTHRADVNVRASRFAGDGVTEREIRNVILHQELEQPVPFGLIRVDRDIHAAAMIEAQRAMHRGVAHR